MAGGDGQETVGRPGPVYARIEAVDQPLGAALRAYGGPRVAWFPPDGPGVVGCEETAVIEAEGPSRFASVRDQAAALFEAMSVDRADGAPGSVRPRLLGGLAFHDGPGVGEPWRGFPPARFVLPRIQLTHVDGRTWLTVTATAEAGDDPSLERTAEAVRERLAAASTSGSPPPGIADVRRLPDRAGWRDQVTAAIERIEAGDLEKVVLAQRLTARIRGALRLSDALDRLGRAYPDCYRFAVDPGLGAAFFGAAPERLVDRRGDRVRTDAIAGSIGRGGTPTEDARLAEVLEGSEKVRHEHAVVVEAIRDQLARVAEGVRVGDRRVRKLSNVQHLEVPLTARLRDPTHVLDLVSVLHPTPAVGGRPPEAADRFIEATEPFDRGWYASPVGWFDAEGDGTFAVGIRSAVATTDRATLFAGNGIVADSDPDDEWDELQLKYRPILDLLR